MTGTATARIGTLAIAVLVTGLAACGGSDDSDNPTTPSATTAQTPSSALAYEQFLMLKGEEPGFEPGRAGPHAQPASAKTITGLDAFANEMQLTPADKHRLQTEGFIAFTLGPIRGPHSAGITNVAVYKTADGAKHSMAHDLRPSVIHSFGPIEGLQFFTVSGVPGARGWTASKPHVGNVSWVQGRCYLTLGNQGPGPFPDALSQGARAIYKRTNGQCP